MTLRRTCALVITLLATTLPSTGISQTAADEVEQLLTDLDALVIGTQVSMRCSLYDSSLAYLTPLEATGAEIRMREIEATLRDRVDGLAEQISEMRAEANAIACGAPGLEPFLDFNRQTASDVIDIGLFAWRSIDIAQCSYFVDDEFFAAAQRAKDAGEALDLSGDPERAAYVQQTAQAWTTVFADNCFNLSFQPAPTLLGLVALALPVS
jgi:hypothetical protein